MRRSGASRLAAAVGVIALAGACTSGGGPILANPTAPRPSIAAPTTRPSSPADPVPIELPARRRPARSADRMVVLHRPPAGRRDGDRFGFEYVIFRAERGAFPTSWVSHLAVTDESGDRFLYSQRLETGPQVDRSPRGADGTPSGFDLALAANPASPAASAASAPPAWSMSGGGGSDRLTASLSPDEAARPVRPVVSGSISS